MIDVYNTEITSGYPFRIPLRELLEVPPCGDNATMLFTADFKLDKIGYSAC